MAKIIENEKGFKVIEVSNLECICWGGYAICDNCNDAFYKGFYVAVLNRVFCPKCYEDFMQYATYYPEDSKIEIRNFEYMKSQVGL